MDNKIRSMYAILPEVVYQGSSLVPAHTDPLSRQAILATAIYINEAGEPLTFAEQFPGARQSVDGTKRLIKDCDWSWRDLFGIEMLIALAGVNSEAAGVGVMQYFEVTEIVNGPEWITQEG